MVQSLMALLALLATLFFVYNQQQNLIQVERALIRSELAAQATSVAVDRLEEIGAMPFDRFTIGETRVAGRTGLTAASDFEYAVPPADVDDFHGARVVQERVLWGDTMRFQVNTRVAYASEGDPGLEVTGLRTKFKKVTATVYSLNQHPADTIRIAQTFACGSLCEW